MSKLTDKQKSWIIKHFKNTKNDVILEKFNITHSALHRFARENGLKKTKQFQRKCQLNASAMANVVNRRNNWPPKGYKIPKSEEYRFKTGESLVKKLGKKKNQERIIKSAASRRNTVRAEKRRVLFGFDQKTKLKVVAAPPGKNAFRYVLKKRGYLVERGSPIVYFDDRTNRSTATEQTANSKYSFTIKQV